MKKAISPLISYILLIGMVVAMSTMVATYLIKQSSSISFESKEFEIYCADVAMDAQVQCYTILNDNANLLMLNLTNRGSFSVVNLSIVRKDGTVVKNLIPKDEFDYAPYLNDGSLDTAGLPINPGKKGRLDVVVSVDAEVIKTTELTITPWITIDDKPVICNEKVFKVTSNSISSANQCA